MLYCLEQGRTERRIIEECIRRKRALPKAIKEAPRLQFGLELFFDAWCDLQGDRGGMGDGRIPWTAIESYCRYNDYDEDLREDTHYLIRAMDEAWCVWHQAQRDKEKNKMGK